MAWLLGYFGSEAEPQNLACKLYLRLTSAFGERCEKAVQIDGAALVKPITNEIPEEKKTRKRKEKGRKRRRVRFEACVISQSAPPNIRGVKPSRVHYQAPFIDVIHPP